MVDPKYIVQSDCIVNDKLAIDGSVFLISSCVIEKNLANPLIHTSKVDGGILSTETLHSDSGQNTLISAADQRKIFQQAGLREVDHIRLTSL